MSDVSIADPMLKSIRRSGTPSIALDGASWLVWPPERRSGVSAGMSSAQFVHLNAPVIAVQRNGRMEYFDEERQLRWTSNLPWPRANLEMARLPGRPDFLGEDTGKEDPDEDDSTRV